MSGDEIEFGELEEASYGQRRRPDRDGHFAVVPYAEPRPDDLPGMTRKSRAESPEPT